MNYESIIILWVVTPFVTVSEEYMASIFREADDHDTILRTTYEVRRHQNRRPPSPWDIKIAYTYELFRGIL
jgi:hypothetical protein